MFKSLLVFATTFILSQQTIASDHIDGVPSLSKHQQVDLTDLYAFQSPNRPGYLTVILNLYPGVSKTGHFSSKVDYDIKLREVLPSRTPMQKTYLSHEAAEVNIHCYFTDPGHHKLHAFEKKDRAKGTCKFFKNSEAGYDEIKSITTQIDNSTRSADEHFSFFAGSRSDAFFINSDVFADVTQRKGFRAITDGSGDNVMESINVLSIALEFKLSELFSNSADMLLAVAAQSTVTDGGVKKVLDRVGRPEITNLSMHRYLGSESVKFDYNKYPVFESTLPSTQNKFRKRLKDNISAYDMYDQVSNWGHGDLDGLTSILVDDYLILNTSANCLESENNFFTIERDSFHQPVGLQNCGGRGLNDDIMATLYALYIGGPFADPVDFSSGVDAPYHSSNKKLLSDFPYLAKPERTFMKLNIKRAFLNGLLKKESGQDKAK